MRILLSVLFLTVFAWAGDRDDVEAKIQAAKERLHAVLMEAEELERAGRAEDAARLREKAERLEREIREMARWRGDRAPSHPEFQDPLVQAIHGLEVAIEGLRRAGYEEGVRDLERMADRLRAQRKERERRRLEEQSAHRGGWDPDFERRTIDIYRMAMKAFAEAEKRDAADLVERAIHARELLLAGRHDEEAHRIIEKSPGDAQLGKLLLAAAEIWRGFERPEPAERCEELGRHLLARAGKPGARAEVQVREGPAPEVREAMHRIERLEERLERMEHMLHEVLARLEAEREHR